MAALRNALSLAGRLLLAALFLADGWLVTQNYGGTAEYLAAYGVPPQTLPLALALQVLGGALVAIGWWTRPSALALAAFCISTALIFHHQFGDTNEFIQFWKDLAIAGGFLTLAAHGAGAWSVDGKRTAK